MDLVHRCREKISSKITELKAVLADQHIDDETLHNQNLITSAIVERDKNLDKILDQQTSIKTIIETDNVIRSLRKQIDQDTKAIDTLRKAVAKLASDALKNRSEQLEQQAKDVERFQMNQLRSIAEDYKRHQDILEFRKKEIADMKKEIEKEENGREAYLAAFEKNLEKTLQARQAKGNTGDSLFPFSGMDDDFDEPELQLTSINEYDPYGKAADTNATTTTTGAKRGRGSRGRGGRGRRGASSASAK